MSLLKSSLFTIQILVFGALAFADEVAEPVATEPTPVYDQSGRVVNPENQLGDEDEKVTEESSSPKADPLPAPPPAGLVPKAFAKMGVGDYFSRYAFLVDKKTRTLSIWENSATGPVFIEAHATDLGRKPGDKQVLGDKRTPEGIYFFQTTYSGSSLDFNEYGAQAFTMDYPNLFDRRESKTGSGIWLHAVPDTKTLYRGSRGCIVVRNQIITKLARYIDLKKTPIVVQNQAEYITPAQYLTEQKSMLNWLETWRESWESMEIETYLSHYSDDFSSNRMNKQQWREYKAGLNKKYEFIRVQVAKPSVIFHEDEAIVRFLQVYSSDINRDFGEKILHMIKAPNGKYQIVAENWSPLSNSLLALLEKADEPKKKKEM
jgi:murein L,D-transpeptidase YafK